MKEENKIITYQVLSHTELPAKYRELREQALAAAHQAYAPYSHFQVGAAVLLENGEIIIGNNQENAAYPSGLCAERVALFYASSRFPDIPVCALAVVAIKDNQIQPAISPCGACCQVLVETENRAGNKLTVLLCGSEENCLLTGVSSLLPFSFSPSSLNPDQP